MATIRILRSTTINQRSIARSFSTALPPPLYITDKTTTKVISPFHDIPWKPTNNPTIYNFVCEIPKGVLPPKLEIDTDKPFNPIVQDKVSILYLMIILYLLWLMTKCSGSSLKFKIWIRLSVVLVYWIYKMVH